MGEVIPVDFVRYDVLTNEQRNSMTIYEAITCEAINMISAAGGDALTWMNKYMQCLNVVYRDGCYSVELHGQQIATMPDIEYTGQQFNRLTQQIAASLI